MINALRQLVKDKTVLLLGFGREGRSTYNALLKAEGCKEIAIADANEVEAPDKNVRVFCGENYQAVMDDFDIVFKSPGIVLEKDIREYKCLVTCQTNVFMEHYKSQIIGITGTKGKSTTTTLLYHVLSNSGVSSVMVGNIGIPCFDKAEEISPHDRIVFELSCHQLEYATASPHIGVVINLFEEHLDHYGTIEKYFAAKKNIYRFQSENDLLFCGVQCADMLEDVKGTKITVSSDDRKADIVASHGKVSYKGNTLDIPTDEIHLLGEHNFFNIGMVYGISKELGVSDKDFISALRSYSPPPHRLEYCGTYGDVKFYDDSISTICETCINAIKSVADIETILIGGMDRGIDYKELEEYISRQAGLNIILMADSGKRIYREMTLSGLANPRIRYVTTLEEAVALAKKITSKGRSCVLSPAAASYGIFKNFEERGDRFKELVRG